MAQTTRLALFGPVFVAAAFHLPPLLCCHLWPWSVTWQLGGNLGVGPGHHRLSRHRPGEVLGIIIVILSLSCCQLTEVNKSSTKKRKKKSPVSEVVDTEKKLKFRNV